MYGKIFIYEYNWALHIYAAETSGNQHDISSASQKPRLDETDNLVSVGVYLINKNKTPLRR